MAVVMVVVVISKAGVVVRFLENRLKFVMIKMPLPRQAL